MKKLLTPWLILLVLLLGLAIAVVTSHKPEWRYEIRGKVEFKDTLRDAIWYCDSVQINDNSVQYQNSDGTVVIISAPYVLIDKKTGEKIIDVVK